MYGYLFSLFHLSLNNIIPMSTGFCYYGEEASQWRKSGQ